jgi:hypothetical protein
LDIDSIRVALKVIASAPMRNGPMESMRFALVRSKYKANPISMPDNFEKKSSTPVKYSATGFALDYRNFKAESGQWHAGHHCLEIFAATRTAVSP